VVSQTLIIDSVVLRKVSLFGEPTVLPVVVSSSAHDQSPGVSTCTSAASGTAPASDVSELGTFH
jgi:hypothetical protein